MDREQFLRMMERILELKPRALVGGERLATLEQWDSVAILEYIAAVDHVMGVILNVEEIAASRTFDDLFSRLEESVCPKR